MASPRPAALPREQWDRVIAAAARHGEAEREQALLALRDQAILALFFFAGLRCGELCALDVADVDLEGGQVHARHAGGRTAAVGAVGLDRLEAYLDARPECEVAGREPLFVSRKGGRLSASGVRRLVGRVETVLGDVVLHPRACRRAHITEILRQAARKGHNLEAVAAQAGHAAVRSTRRYAP